jgi:Na+/H+-dicarboxylate symporter
MFVDPAGIRRSTGAFYLSLATLLPQVAALVLGILGLREAEMSPKIGGWSLALTGVLTASTACILTVLVTAYAPRLGFRLEYSLQAASRHAKA